MKCDCIHFFIFNGMQPSKMVAQPCATETLNKLEFPYLCSSALICGLCFQLFYTFFSVASVAKVLQ